jgi:uncharacterized membrane protein (DUF373 family)
MKAITARWRFMTERWPTLSFYQQFESVLAFALTIVITLVILVALYGLIVDVIGGLVLGVLDPLEHRAFQLIFGEIITVLIALEFNHTLVYVVTREQSIIQTKVVLLIALLALARKFIIMDLTEITPEQMLGLAAITLALGVTYWLMRERDDRLARGAAK